LTSAIMHQINRWRKKSTSPINVKLAWFTYTILAAPDHHSY